MKFPHEKYITTLVAGRMTNLDILRKLKKTSVNVPPPREVDAIRNKLREEKEEYFLGKEDVDLDWLKELDIEEMFGYEFGIQVYSSIDGIKGAFQALNDPNLYRTISVLALANVFSDDLELIINSKYDVEYSSDDLDMFLKYFFNVKGWTMFDKERYVEDVKDENLRFFYSIALREEKDYVMWKLGLAPSKTFDSMLKDMAIDSYYNFKEQTTRNPDQAQKWGSLMMKLQERIDKIETDLKEDSDVVEDLKNAFEDSIKKASRSSKSSEKEYKNPFEEKNAFKKEVPKILNLEEIRN